MKLSKLLGEKMTLLHVALFGFIGTIISTTFNPSLAKTEKATYQAILCDLAEPDIDRFLDFIETSLLSITLEPTEYFAVTEGTDANEMTITFTNFNGDPELLERVFFNAARAHNLTIAFRWLDTHQTADFASCKN